MNFDKDADAKALNQLLAIIPFAFRYIRISNGWAAGSMCLQLVWINMMNEFEEGNENKSCQWTPGHHLAIMMHRNRRWRQVSTELLFINTILLWSLFFRQWMRNLSINCSSPLCLQTWWNLELSKLHSRVEDRSGGIVTLSGCFHRYHSAKTLESQLSGSLWTQFRPSCQDSPIV